MSFVLAPRASLLSEGPADPASLSRGQRIPLWETADVSALPCRLNMERQSRGPGGGAGLPQSFVGNTVSETAQLAGML